MIGLKMFFLALEALILETISLVISTTLFSIKEVYKLSLMMRKFKKENKSHLLFFKPLKSLEFSLLFSPLTMHLQLSV
jgi:hypothetical protein